MNRTATHILSIVTSLSLANCPLIAQSIAEPLPPTEGELAPVLQGIEDLKKLEQQIISLAKQAQPATVCLNAKDGSGSGSGVVVSEDGLILTAAHVTSSMKDGFEIIFPDGTIKTGTTLGADYERDAAMVQISEEGKYPFVKIGKSGSLLLDQWTIALGHSGGFDPKRKPPIRLGRIFDNGEFIATDTAVVVGDSGGPLFDILGQVVGIHSNIGATLSENHHVPIDAFLSQWEDLKSGKFSGSQFDSSLEGMQDPDQAVFGASMENKEGVAQIAEVFPESPAAKGGLLAGDIVKKINDQDIKSAEQLLNLINEFEPGDELKVTFQREEEDHSTKITLMSFEDYMIKSEQGELDFQNLTPEEIIDELLEAALQNGGELDITPELIEKLGGMEKLMKELQKRGVIEAEGEAIDGEINDKFYDSVVMSLAPVLKKNQGVTVSILIDGEPAVLGTIISPDGRILTKNTETDQGEISIEINGKTYQPKVLKRFPLRDLALLKIDAHDLNTVKFQPKEPELGAFLLTSDPIEDMIGFGLLGVSGRAMPNIGYLGIEASEDEKGILVAGIDPDGAAEAAGMKEGDIITHVSQREITDPLAFVTHIRGRKAGEKIEIGYLRDNKSANVTVTLKDRQMDDQILEDPRMLDAVGPLSEVTSGYPDALQHDIPLPPEMCGGPLFNLKGECIGINVSRAGRTKTYAIPSDEILEILKTVDTTNTDKN